MRPAVSAAPMSTVREEPVKSREPVILRGRMKRGMLNPLKAVVENHFLSPSKTAVNWRAGERPAAGPPVRQ